MKHSIIFFLLAVAPFSLAAEPIKIDLVIQGVHGHFGTYIQPGVGDTISLSNESLAKFMNDEHKSMQFNSFIATPENEKYKPYVPFNQLVKTSVIHIDESSTEKMIYIETVAGDDRVVLSLQYHPGGIKKWEGFIICSDKNYAVGVVALAGNFSSK